MSDLEDFSLYYVQDPESVDHVLLNIPQLKVHKSLLLQNAITKTAQLHGWNNNAPENAIEKCFALIKAYVNEQAGIAMVRAGYKEVDEGAAYAKANLF